MSIEMKDSGVQPIGKIPVGWRISKFKYISNLYTGKSISDKEKDNYMNSNNAIPYIATKNIELNINEANYANGLYTKKDDKYFRVAPANSTLMCIEGGSAGRKNTLVSTDVSFVNKLCCFSPLRVDPIFQYLFLNSPSFSAEFEMDTSGLIGGVSVSQLNNFHIPYPVKDKQKEIAKFLYKKVISINTIIKKTKDSIDEYKRLKQSVITELVTMGLDLEVKLEESGIEWVGKIPTHWNTIRLKYIIKERNERSTDGTELPLSMSQIYGLIPSSEMDRIPNQSATNIGNKIVCKNDIVFNKLKAHLGVFSLSQYDGLVSPDYAVYYSINDINVKYYEYIFKTDTCITEFIRYSKGVAAGLTRLYSDDLLAIRCPIPDRKEQDKIADFILKYENRINKILNLKEQLISELENYKKSLIYEYITGKRED